MVQLDVRLFRLSKANDPNTPVDILLGSPLPLQLYLLDHPRLSIRLIADGKVFGETQPMNGDLATGIWDIPSSFQLPEAAQWLTLAVVAHEGRIRVQFASAAYSVKEILSRVEIRPNGYQEFNIGDTCSVHFLMSCLVETVRSSVADGLPPQVIALRDTESTRLSNLGFASFTRFRHTRRLADIDSAISSLRKVVELTPDGHPAKPGRINGLGITLGSRFEHTGSLADIDSAISNLRKALEITPGGHPDNPGRLSNLGMALMVRFDRLGNPMDNEDAISRLREAGELIPDGDPDGPGRLSSLGISLKQRFNRSGNLIDIEDAISSLRKAVELTPDGDPDKPTQLNSHGNALIARFERLGSLMDIEDAISCLRKAIELTPNGHPERPEILNSLGIALNSRFERTGDLSDNDSATSSLQKAVELTPDGHPEKPGRLCNLGMALMVRFQRLGNIMDIEDAISSVRKGVELIPNGDPAKPALLSNLGGAFLRRFERTGSLVDIESAISSLRKAIELTPDDHPDKPERLGNVGVTLTARFQRLGSRADIEDAISSVRKALELTPDGHPNKPGQLHGLGIALSNNFQRTNSLTDIEDAISSLRKAVELTPDGHPDKSGQLSSLGGALDRRFGRTGSLADMEDSVSSLKKAVELTPDGHPNKPAQLDSLGKVLMTRFERISNIKDIEDSISCLKKAVDITPDGHPASPTLLSDLGHALRLRFRHSYSSEDLEYALHSFSTSANSAGGRAMTRFQAAWEWARIANAISQTPLPAFSRAIDLLPQIAWLGLAVTDQHALLADVGDVVRDAVAAAIQWEELETAVEWAEQGRSIVWQNMLRLRTPVDELEASHPHLAIRVRDISRRMEVSTSHDAVDAAQISSQLAIEWENTVEEIRQHAGFDGFLRAKTFGQLAPAACEGPVVILNVNTSRCDALVLIADDSDEKQVSVIKIPLSDFSYELGKKLSEKLTSHLTSAGVRARGENRKTGRSYPEGNGEAVFNNILRILWLAVVKPVIDALAYPAKPEHLARIWWCATGSLAFLPIHAAGIYGAEGEDRLSDYVVSSYTPTLTAILVLSEPPTRDDFKILTVAQPSTPYATPIPKTEDEIKKVQTIAGDTLIVSLTNEEATVERVLRGMRDTDWIHLACHGRQCTGDPMKSGLLLHDKILDLSAIVKQAHPRAELAFLSACQTATGDERIADESVHLAAGMLLAGYRGVIATMWSINDSDAPQIAEDVYTRILKGGRPNRKEAAYALHDAVKRLRDSEASFLSLVPFIHIGR